MKKVSVLILIAIIALSSCAGLKEIDIREVNHVNTKLLNMTTVELEFECVVNNPANRRIIMEDAIGTLKKSDIVFARINLIEVDTVAANTVSSNKIRLKVNIEDPLSLLSMGMDVSSWNISEFKADIRTTIRREGKAKHVFKRKNIPMERFMTNIIENR